MLPERWFLRGRRGSASLRSAAFSADWLCSFTGSPSTCPILAANLVTVYLIYDLVPRNHDNTLGFSHTWIDIESAKK